MAKPKAEAPKEKNFMDRGRPAHLQESDMVAWMQKVERQFAAIGHPLPAAGATPEEEDPIEGGEEEPASEEVPKPD